MKSINPYLIFNGNAEEAFEYYQSVFGGDLEKIRFGDMPGSEKMPEEVKNKLAHVCLPVNDGSDALMGSDHMPGYEVNITENSNHHIHVEAENKSDAERFFKKLSESGQVTMPLESTDWAECFGMVSDKYGIQWMISYGGK